MPSVVYALEIFSFAFAVHYDFLKTPNTQIKKDPRRTEKRLKDSNFEPNSWYFLTRIFLSYLLNNSSMIWSTIS